MCFWDIYQETLQPSFNIARNKLDYILCSFTTVFFAGRFTVAQNHVREYYETYLPSIFETCLETGITCTSIQQKTDL